MVASKSQPFSCLLLPNAPTCVMVIDMTIHADAGGELMPTQQVFLPTEHHPTLKVFLTVCKASQAKATGQSEMFPSHAQLALASPL